MDAGLFSSSQENGSQWPQDGFWTSSRPMPSSSELSRTCHEVLKPYDIDLLAEF